MTTTAGLRSEPTDRSLPLSVIIPTRDRSALLGGALLALRGIGVPVDRVVVVDSASQGADVRRTALDAGVRFIRCELPGASRARNAGWRATDTELVAFLDDDCRPCPNWAPAMVAAFQEPKAGFVFGRVTVCGGGIPLSVVDLATAKAFSLEDDPTTLGGCANLACRRAALEQAGGFDEVLGAGAPLRAAEDKDLMWRLLHCGWQGRYQPEAAVLHEAWRGRLQALRTVYGYGVGTGAFQVKAKRLFGDGAPLRDGVWRYGLRQAVVDLKNRYQFGAVSDVVQAAGALVGTVAAGRRQLKDGHYAERRRTG